MRVLGIIPARGGSKGVPRKNVKLLCGKPLLAYTAEGALRSQMLSKVVLTTDDDEIAEIGKSLGLEVPFLRPAELAEDTTPTLPVVVHALHQMEERGENFDAICLLQPTNPLRRVEDIDACIQLLQETRADSVISVLRVPDTYNPRWVYWKNDRGELTLCTGEKEPVPRRQDLPAAFCRDGTIYATRTDTVMIKNSLYGQAIHGYEILPEFSSNIDTVDDWKEIESRINMSNEGN